MKNRMNDLGFILAGAIVTVLIYTLIHGANLPPI